jgi:hypothetical protein
MTPREENARKAARRRFEARNLIFRFKKRHLECKDCGQSWHPCQLDFYRPQGGPSRAISRRLLRSLDVIQTDMEACDLVCANCGRLRTWHAQRAKRAGPT